MEVQHNIYAQLIAYWRVWKYNTRHVELRKAFTGQRCWSWQELPRRCYFTPFHSVLLYFPSNFPVFSSIFTLISFAGVGAVVSGNEKASEEATALLRSVGGDAEEAMRLLRQAAKM